MKKEIYQTIKSPHLTEKVTDLMHQSNQYAFKVDINSTKREIKKAVESYFSVEVEEVRVLTIKGKKKRSRYKVKKDQTGKKHMFALLKGNQLM